MHFLTDCVTDWSLKENFVTDAFLLLIYESVLSWSVDQGTL